MSIPDPALLVRQLINLAEREREALALGADNWEQVIVARDEFDGTFGMLERAVDSRALTGRERNDLVRLQHLHAENMRIADELRAQTGQKLGELSNVRKIGGYAPLGSSYRPTPRYLDSSA